MPTGSSITSVVDKPITLGPSTGTQSAGYYPSPLTIESGGSVDLETSSKTSNYFGQTAIASTAADVSLTLFGGATTVYGSGGIYATAAGGGVDLTASATVLVDAEIHGGNIGWQEQIAGNGGVGLSMNGGSLTVGNGASGNGSEVHGVIEGGSGYGAGHTGGDAVDATGIKFINGEDGSYGSIVGGRGYGGASGGTGLSLNGGMVYNGGLPGGPFGSSTIEGGLSKDGAGGVGIQLRGGAGLDNYNDVAGGGGTTSGGVGLDAGANSLINNNESITGGTGGTGAGGDGADLAAGAQLTNNFFVRGGGNLSGNGGNGVDLTGTGAKLINTYKIYGGNATSASADAGDGVIVTFGTSVINTSAGEIYGGNSAAAGHGGYGVYLDGGSVTSARNISGGAIANNSGNPADSVKFGALGGTLTLQSAAISGGNGWNLSGDVAGFNANSEIILQGNSPGNVTGLTSSGHYELKVLVEEVDGFIPINHYIIFSGTYAQKLNIQSDGHGNTDITLPCYVRGTRVRTARGEVRVEELAVGDQVLTASGGQRPVRWLGSRTIDCSRYRDPSSVWPICIRSGAFAEQVPVRDLWVSPGHAIAMDGNLIQACNLVNGVTIVQVPRNEIEYWHVELDQHDVLFAEGLAAESYLDTGNRAAFTNGDAFLEAFPDFLPKHWAETCLPLALEGEPVRCAKATLIERAKQLGYAISDDAQLHLLADGQRIEPIWLSDTRLAFTVPTESMALELRCRTFVPAHVDAVSHDPRELGICVGRLQLDGSDVALDDESMLQQGWHELEGQAQGHPWRWSQGRISLPAGTRLIVIDLEGRGYYWSRPVLQRLACVS